MLSVSASLSTAAEAHSRAKGSIGKQVQTMRMWQLSMPRLWRYCDVFSHAAQMIRPVEEEMAAILRPQKLLSANNTLA